jgi:GNAT superfamily N-acetyltransferase
VELGASRLRMDDETLLAAIHADTTEIYVLYLDGAPAGFFEVNRADPAVTDLAYFGLMPHAAGRGLGRWFLSRAIEACWANTPREDHRQHLHPGSPGRAVALSEARLPSLQTGARKDAAAGEEGYPPASPKAGPQG